MPEADWNCAISGVGDAIGAGLEGHGELESSRFRKDGKERNDTVPRQAPLGSLRHHALHRREKEAIEPGLVPLAHGIPARMVRLRGYGNAIVPQVAAEFVQAYLDISAP
jgi:DNA (cytosine-5)-methyltransferase 1